MVNRESHSLSIFSPQALPSRAMVEPPCSPMSLEGFLFLGTNMGRNAWWLKRGRIFRNDNPSNLLSFCDKEYRDIITEKIQKYAPKNREDWTPAEQKFYDSVKFMGFKVRREVSIPCIDTVYFADFFFGSPLFMIVEIDGGVHKHQTEYDSRRDDKIMQMTGWTILRFTNEQVMSDDLTMWTLFFDTVLEISELERYSGVQRVYEKKSFETFIRKQCPTLLNRYWKDAPTPSERLLKIRDRAKRKAYFREASKAIREVTP